MSHIASKKQEELFNKAVEAIKACRKAGLRVYGLSNNLVAYTKQADDYVIQHDLIRFMGSGGQIPCLTSRCLTDCGGDDYPNYRNLGDEQQFNP